MGRLSDLHRKLVAQYDAEEFKVLCFDLDVPYDALTGEALPARAAAFLRYLDTRNRLPDLVAKVRQDRPQQNWEVPEPRAANEPNDGLDLPSAIKGNTGNVANVQGSTNVNVFQIGSLNIPRKLLFGLIGVVAVIGLALAGLVWRGTTSSQQGQKKISEQISTLQVTPTPGPQRMDGPFNIAVAPFSQSGANGQAEFTKEGLELSDWIYKQLVKEIKETDALVWSDKLPASQKGATLGIITGTTSAERQQSAQRLAQRVGAHLVIFGQLTGEGSAGQFAPEFYIDSSPDKFKGEAEEVIGEHKLGTPIRVPRPMQLNADATMRMNRDLNARAIFVKGVLLDLIGDHRTAYEEFASIKDSWDRVEAEGAGKEVLPQFMARQLVFILDNPAELKKLKLSRDAALAEAQTLVTEALLLNPDYGLAYLQQGNLALSRAEPAIRQMIMQLGDTGTLTFTAEYTQAKTEVLSATAAYNQFLKLAQSKGQGDGLLITKAQISLANAQHLNGYCEWLEQHLAAANAAFESANQTLDLAFAAGVMDKPRLRVTAQWIRGDIAIGQATVQYQSGDDAAYAASLKRAEAALDSCAQQKSDVSDIDETLKKIQAQCREKLDQLKGAK